jgi:dienelactone hydrolase
MGIYGKIIAAGLLAASSALASAQALKDCVPPAQGAAFTVHAQGRTAPISGVAMGQGERAVVFSNTAYNAPCGWVPAARELVARGYQVALWSYEAGDLQQIGELQAVVAHMRSRGAKRVALVGGSRGGCLSMMTASDLGPQEIAGVAILSCAAIFNRRDPTPTAPWVAKLRVPLLHMTGANDGTPTVKEAQDEFLAYPLTDKKLIVVPGTGAHGDQLLTDPAAAAVASPALIGFLERVLPP